MITSQMIKALVENHSTAATFINALPDESFEAAINGKWSPGQQLEHLILCLRPISQVLASPSFIEEKYGTLNRPLMDYDQVLQTYREGLEKGGKAPERFLPQQVGSSQRAALNDELDMLLSTIARQLLDYSELQLDTLVLPHPFLGMLSIRELIYLMSYHPLHHLAQVQHNLVYINEHEE